MDEKEPQYVVCRNGVFTLPAAVVRALHAQCRGPVYMREDEDVLTISATRLVDGHSRPLTPRFRAAMFRNLTRLAIVELNDSVRVMGIR